MKTVLKKYDMFLKLIRHLFRFLRTSFYSQLKSKVDNIFDKVTQSQTYV